MLPIAHIKSHIQSAVTILNAYKGVTPFSNYLKEYFSRHKKFGSKDRKSISHLCYASFRLGNAIPSASLEERIQMGVFLCNANIEHYAALYESEWMTLANKNYSEKIAFLKGIYPLFEEANIFSWKNELSNNIDFNEFNLSHLQQCSVFIRIRQKYENSVLEKLKTLDIQYHIQQANCIAIESAINLNQHFEIDKEIVIQDYASQQVAAYLKLIPNSNPLYIWDCCAGSGGKSILAYDTLQHTRLTVSDSRKFILETLKARFKTVGIRFYQAFHADLVKPIPNFNHSKFDLIIADVPCTGSGTWGRNPEHLSFFKTATIQEYAAKQKLIVSHALLHLEKGGYFLYITCSVFKAENEAIVEFIQQHDGLKLLQCNIIRGFHLKADTMFAALFIKN